MSYKSLCSTTKETKTKTDIILKCPLVKLENACDILTVEFNTLASPDIIQENSVNTCTVESKDWKYINSYKMCVSGLTSKSSLNKKWNMITVVVQETYPSDPLPIRNKVRCTIYINGGMELDKYADGAFNASDISVLKQNQGNLYVAPTIKDSTGKTISADPTKSEANKLLMADMTFYNYALDTVEINSIFSSGFTKQWAPVMSASTTTSLANPPWPTSTPSDSYQVSTDSSSFKVQGGTK